MICTIVYYVKKNYLRITHEGTVDYYELQLQRFEKLTNISASRRQGQLCLMPGPGTDVGG